MTPHLQIVKGAPPGEVPLTRDCVILGRDPGCHVVIPVTSVSREHAYILRVDGQFFIEDQKSRNGTFVNNEPVTQRRRLRNNDRIRICDFQATFHEGRPPPPSGWGKQKEDEPSSVSWEERRVHVRVSAAQPLAVAGGVNVPDYLSPAQIDQPGDGPAKSAADDLHAVGVIAFQMLLGDLPFPDQPLMAKLEAIAQRRFASAEQRCGERGFGTQLAPIIDKALAGRYRQSRSMLDNLPRDGAGSDLAAPGANVGKSVTPLPYEGFAVNRMLFEDTISEAYEARGLVSGAPVTLRLFKPAFQGDRYVALARELVPGEPPEESSLLPGILRRYRAGRARPTPVRAGQEVRIDSDLESPGCLTLVEEFAGSRTLMDVLRAGELIGDEARVTAVLSQLLAVLAEAHGRGCVHGNLTPYCVFLGPDDAVKIEGFGLHTEVEVIRMTSGGDAQSCCSTMLLLEQHPGGKLRALLEISDNLSKTLELDRLLPKVVDSLFQVFRQADRCFIIFVEEGTNRLLPRVIKTRRPQDEENARFSRTIVRQCVERKQAFLSNNADGGKQALTQSVVDLRIRSVMCVPLIGADGGAFGVIQLDTQDRSKKFTQDDLNLFNAVANPASIALENARLYRDAEVRAGKERELDLARQAQRLFRPGLLPATPGYEFFAYQEPADDVGGDYHDLFPLPRGRVAVLIGDVSGRGLAAAMLMARFSAEARASLVAEADAARAVARLNEFVCHKLAPAGRFVTLAAAVLDPAAHTLVLVNAGHPAPLLYRAAGGSVEEAIPAALTVCPLGVGEGQTFEIAQVSLGPGDCLLMFSDGMTGTRDPDGRRFGASGLRAATLGEGPRSPRAIGERALDAVERHVAGRPWHDDLAVLCVGRREDRS
jgi:serine phosphatase RsbU (regulator of sigma subunit)/serine/threonine protein kinase